MNTVAELEQLMSKEAWTQEDCLRLREAIGDVKDPVKKFSIALAEMSAANPIPAGATAVKLGIANYILCRFNEALELLSKGTDNKERRFYQALCYKHLRQWDKAIESFGFAEDRGWNPKEVTLETAEAQCLAGDAEAAIRSNERFAKSSQEDANWHHVAGMIAEMQGDYDAAVQSYEAARRLQPGHSAATFRLAYYYDLHGDTETAMKLYMECVTRSEIAEGETTPPQPIHANALLNLSVLYEDTGQYEQAEYCLRRILACNPNHPRAKLFLDDVIASKTMVFDEDEAKRLARRNDLLAIPVTDFELSVRARNCLKKMSIRSLGDLLHVTEPELLSYKNFGETSLAEIKSMLAIKKLSIGQMRETDEDETELTDEAEGDTTVGDEGVLATPLAQIELSVRVRKVLDHLKIKTLGELAGKTEPELLACQNFGKTSLDEVELRLKDYGLSLRETP